jgi:hypothetical protein
MEFIYTALLVIIIAFLLMGLMRSRAQSNRIFYQRNLPLREGFLGQVPSVSSIADQIGGQSQYYNWGTEPAQSQGSCLNGECPSPPPRGRICPEGEPCREAEAPTAGVCDSCDILKHKDIKYFTLKSSIPACPDMSDYVKKSEIPPMPDMKDYIKKSEIPPCAKCPDLNDYVPKSSLPAMPECPKCPVCPVCPVCPETYDDITKHPDFKKYISKNEAQEAMARALERQAKNLLQNLRCPPCVNGKEESRPTRRGVDYRTESEISFSRPMETIGNFASSVRDVAGSIVGRFMNEEQERIANAEADRRALQQVPAPANITNQGARTTRQNRTINRNEIPANLKEMPEVWASGSPATCTL